MNEQVSDELTVIIPTWNGEKLLPNCLDALSRQTAPFSLLIVDNGSTDATRHLIDSRYARSGEFRQFRYLGLDQNLGFARAVNIGIRNTSAPFIALLNNDTEADPRWVESGLEAFQKYPDCWFFASRMINYYRRDRLDSAGDCYNRRGLPYKRGMGEPIDRFPYPEPVLGASAGAAFYRRQLFEKIGFFDEDYFMYLEDVDLSLRAQLAGFGCVYLPEAIVYHMEAASDPQLSRKEGFPTENHCFPDSGRLTRYSKARVYWITRNRWQLMVSHQPVRHFPWLIYGWFKSFLFHLLKAGYWGSFCRGLLAGMQETPSALRKRFEIRGQRKLSTRQLCRLLHTC